MFYVVRSIKSCEVKDGGIDLALAGMSPTTRVHVVTRRFIDSSVSLSEMLVGSRMAIPVVAILSTSIAQFVDNRRLGDELVYCAARGQLRQPLSSMLPAPSLLIHPHDLGEAPSTIQNAMLGTKVLQRFFDVSNEVFRAT